MEGVEILSTSEVVVGYVFNVKVYLIALVIITGLMTLISCFNGGFYFEEVVIGLITGIIFGAILGIFPAMNSTPSKYETRYKVIVSDEVPMNEFLNKYEIISQEGKIYTVRDIE